MLHIQDQISLAAAITTVGDPIPAGQKRIFKAAGIVNKTGLAGLVNIYLVPEGATAGPDNLVIINKSISTRGDSCIELIGRGLNAGGTLQISCTTGADMSIGYTAIDTIIN